MEISNQPKLKFHGVNFMNVDLKVKKHYDNKAKIDLNIEPKVFYPSANKKCFEIVMGVSIACKDFFYLKVLGLGWFEIIGDLENDDLKKSFVNANAPAIMFPYVRAFITTLTSNLGDKVTGAIIIPTQFFKGDLTEITETDEKV